MVDSEEEKQNYLRENILDKGYVAEDFVSYLISKKGDEGVDLGNWPLNELKLVVQEYIFTHPIANAQLGNNIQSSPQVQNNNSFSNNFNNINMGMNMNMNMGMNPNTNMGMINNNPEMQSNMNQNYMSYSPENEPDEKTDIYGITNLETILCSICEKSEMSKYENIRVEISLGEKVAGTFFTKAYMTYIITTSPLNLKVRRRYSDFEWLRQILSNFYSSSLIPPIPKKSKIGVDRFEESFLLKRMRTLEKFLSFLLEDPVIKVSQILYDFLSIEEEEKFNDKKKKL